MTTKVRVKNTKQLEEHRFCHLCGAVMSRGEDQEAKSEDVVVVTNYRRCVNGCTKYYYQEVVKVEGKKVAE